MGFSDMVGFVQQRVGNHTLATTVEIGKMVNARHRELLEAHEWSRKKSIIVLSTIPDKTTGTVTLTHGSATLNGLSTAWVATDDGKSILIGNSLFEFNFVSATSGTLSDLQGNAVVWQGITASALSYVMFRRWYTLGIGIESILSVKHQYPIKERDQEWLDSYDLGRTTTGAAPMYYARGPWDQSTANDLVQIEFAPRPSASIDIEVSVQKAHVDLSGATNPIVPAVVVQWFASVDACDFLFVKTKELKWDQASKKYLGYAEDSLEKQKNADSKHFGKSPAVKDVGGRMPLAATDFGLDHDVNF